MLKKFAQQIKILIYLTHHYMYCLFLYFNMNQECFCVYSHQNLNPYNTDFPQFLCNTFLRNLRLHRHLCFGYIKVVVHFLNTAQLWSRQSLAICLGLWGGLGLLGFWGRLGLLRPCTRSSWSLWCPNTYSWKVNEIVKILFKVITESYINIFFQCQEQIKFYWKKYYSLVHCSSPSIMHCFVSI